MNTLSHSVPASSATVAVPTRDDVRAEVAAWLDANWNPDLPLLEWRRRLVDSGWAVPSWPATWCGRDLPGWSDQVVKSELAAYGAAGPPVGAGMWMAAPTILEFGPDVVRERFLVRTLTGELTWCQLFSEPGAGSDMAGVTTRATRDGDEWVIDGQKVWNTSADHADYGMLLARTDWDAPKHQGLTYFILPMKQPGVEVRPLRQMNGYSSFNEVFITEARVPLDHVVAGVGSGWSAALATLAFERRLGAMKSGGRTHPSIGRAVEEARREAAEHFATYSWYPQRAGRTDLLPELARRMGRSNDPIVRQEIAALISLEKIAGWTIGRVKGTRAAGRPAGPESMINKLLMSCIAQRAGHAHSLVSNVNGLMTDPEQSPDGALVAEILLSIPAQSIAGGTDEIQRNILAEKTLGLPREPSSDAGAPFRHVPQNV